MEMPEIMGEMRATWCAGGPSVPVTCRYVQDRASLHEMLDEVGRWLGLERRGSWCIWNWVLEAGVCRHEVKI